MGESKSNFDHAVQNYYAEQGNEKDRLLVHHLERDRTLKILSKRMPSAPATVLDIGGAAGIYSFPLTKSGYKVHLIDPVPLHIEQAREYAKASQIDLASYAIGDARQLPWEDNSIDVALLFGPLYHLFDENDRLQALSEAYRVLRSGGTLFAVGISRFASLMDAMYKDTLYAKFEIIEQDFKTGIHRKISKGIDFAYLHHPAELRKEVSTVGFQNIELISVEGPIWHNDVVDSLYRNQDGWEKLLSLLEKIENEETIVGASAHVMAIAKKPFK